MGKLIKVATMDEVHSGQGKAIELEGKKIALFNVNGTVSAIDDICTHAGGSLSEGQVDGSTVTCPLHGAQFDVASGKVLQGPAQSAVTSYNVKVEGNDIYLEV